MIRWLDAKIKNKSSLLKFNGCDSVDRLLVGALQITGILPHNGGLGLSHRFKMSAGTIAFPIKVIGTVVHGFGRGGKDLGIPTGKNHPFILAFIPCVANLDSTAVELVRQQLDHSYGIYYGWAWFESGRPDKSERYPMVMSFGLNPQYNNQQASAVHTCLDMLAVLISVSV